MQQFYQIMKRCAAVLVLIAVVCSLYVGASRVQAEQSYKNVNLSVNEADIRSLANANGKNMDAMLELLAENGVSQVLFKESTMPVWKTPAMSLWRWGQRCRRCLSPTACRRSAD